ncbi:MAG: DNA polymerase Y family protein [Deltaproteobacteria bacterium]|nr:DNA polymerase Y family protein [Deltaproteobacteria bacterium]
MDRLVCVDLLDLPERLREHEHRGWRGEGYRRALDEAAAVLRGFSPRVEISDDEPGIFFMDVSGLQSLYKSASQWAAALSGALVAAGHEHRIAVGFSRFGVYAVVKNQPSAISHQPSAGPNPNSKLPIVFRSPAAERAAALRVRLARFPLPPDALEALKRLRVVTVGDLLALPADDLLARYDDEVYRFHRFASGERDLPLSPQRPEEEISEIIEVDPPDDNAMRLLFMLKQAMPSLYERVAKRHKVAAGVALELSFGQSAKLYTVVRLARPSRDEGVLMDLIRLRLDTLELPDLVREIRATLIPAAEEPEQLLLVDRPARDPAAAERALARLRTEFGDHAVVRARLRERHLPEHRFVWEPVARVAPAQPVPAGLAGTLVRRLYASPLEVSSCQLPVASRQSPVATHDSRLQPSAPVLVPTAFLGGPYRLSGGWWRRPVERDYYFVETRRGEVLWVFYDRVRRRWFLHGRVE